VEDTVNASVKTELDVLAIAQVPVINALLLVTSENIAINHIAKHFGLYFVVDIIGLSFFT